LSLESNSDFLIALAYAEKMSPGAFLAVHGDPERKQEQLVALLTSF
jgi:hypothetical protein